MFGALVDQTEITGHALLQIERMTFEKNDFPKIFFIGIKSFQNKMLSLQPKSVRTKRNCPIRTKTVHRCSQGVH